MHHTARIIVPMAFDLAWEGGRVVLGPGTKKACDEAISLARFQCNAHLFVSATNAGRKYNHAPHGRMMYDYIREHAPDVAVEFCEAASYDTVGEIVAAALHAKEFVRENRQWLTKVYFMAKRYHSLSVKQLSREVFVWQSVNASHETLIHDLDWFVWHPWLQAAEVAERTILHKRMRKLRALQKAEDDQEEPDEEPLFSTP